MVVFSQRAPAAIRDISHEPQWGELGQVLAGEGIGAALSAPVEVDGSAIGTLDIYSNLPWDWDDSELAALQTYAGLVASLLTAAVTAQVKGRLANQSQAALAHRWLIEQAKGLVMGRGADRVAPGHRPASARVSVLNSCGVLVGEVAGQLAVGVGLGQEILGLLLDRGDGVGAGHPA